MARLGLDINLALQRLLGANKERAAANRGALEDRKLRKDSAEQKAQLANEAPAPGSPTGAKEIRGGTPQLYRAPEPAAQRRKQGLDPVFVITEPFVHNYTTNRTIPPNVAAGDPGTNRKYEIYTGSKGKIAEFYPFALQPFTPVDRSGLELLTSTIATTFDEDRVQDGSLVPLIQTTNGDAFTYAAPVFQHVIDNKLYICIVRASHDWGWNEVFFALYNDQGNAVGTITVLTSSLSTRAKYDLLTVGVDLDTGAVTSSATALYDRTMLGNDYVALGNFTWTTTTTHRKLTEAIHETLSTTHPLKACGPDAWNYLANNYGASGRAAAVVTSGTYELSYEGRPSQPGGATFYLDTNLPGYQSSAPGAVGANYIEHIFPIAFTNVSTRFNGITIAQPFNDRLLSYNTKKNTRLIVESGVMEWAKLPEPEVLNLCAGFNRLFLPASNSYDDYAPLSVQARAKYIRPKGLSPTDRAVVVAEPTTPAPADITPAHESPISITAPKYLRQQTALPSFASSADALHIAYRIL